MVKKSAAEITILWIFFVLFVIYAITLLFPGGVVSEQFFQVSERIYAKYLVFSEGVYDRQLDIVV